MRFIRLTVENNSYLALVHLNDYGLTRVVIRSLKAPFKIKLLSFKSTQKKHSTQIKFVSSNFAFSTGFDL